jgi:hypothetical protein
MGNLNDEVLLPVVRTPHSEVTATLETFARYGVSSHDLAIIRQQPDLARRVARVMKSRVHKSVNDTNGHALNIVSSYELETDYSADLEKLILSAPVFLDQWSGFEYICSCRRGRQNTIAHLVRVIGDSSHQTCLDQLDQIGLTPADVVQGLHFILCFIGHRIPWKILYFPGYVFSTENSNKHAFYTYKVKEGKKRTSDDQVLNYRLGSYAIHYSNVYSNGANVLAVPK